MKCFITVLFGVLCFLTCSTNDPTGVFARDNFITIEAMVVSDTTDATIPTWINETYLSKLMENNALDGAYSVQTLGTKLLDTTSTADFLSRYLIILMSSLKDDLMGLPTSSQAVDANAAINTQYPAGQIVRSWSVSYEKLKSWENEGADKPMQFITMVPTIAAIGFQDTVNNWEINKHVPDHMHSEKLSRVARYKKVSGAGGDISGMPDYIELFYYDNETNFKAHNPGADSVFAAAEQDRADTWRNGELNIPWVYTGAITNEAMK